MVNSFCTIAKLNDLTILHIRGQLNLGRNSNLFYDYGKHLIHIYLFYALPAIDPARAFSLKIFTLGGRGQGLGQLVRQGLDPVTPSTEK